MNLLTNPLRAEAQTSKEQLRIALCVHYKILQNGKSYIRLADEQKARRASTRSSAVH